jgi:hypothetical protein
LKVLDNPKFQEAYSLWRTLFDRLASNSYDESVITQKEIKNAIEAYKPLIADLKEAIKKNHK